MANGQPFGAVAPNNPNAPTVNPTPSTPTVTGTTTTDQVVTTTSTTDVSVTAQVTYDVNTLDPNGYGTIQNYTDSYVS